VSDEVFERAAEFLDAAKALSAAMQRRGSEPGLAAAYGCLDEGLRSLASSQHVLVGRAGEATPYGDLAAALVEAALQASAARGHAAGR
jgi:hypothetical protein